MDKPQSITSRQSDELTALTRIMRGDVAARIAEDFNVCKQTITNIRLGKSWAHIPRPEGILPGRVPEAIVREIKRRLENYRWGDGRRIAREFGVSVQVVSKIRKGRAWCDVDYSGQIEP